MALGLFCYTTSAVCDTMQVLTRCADTHTELFYKKFIISNARPANSIHQYIASGHGLAAQTTFLISLNDESATGLISELSHILKTAFAKDGIVILHENETLV